LTLPRHDSTFGQVNRTNVLGGGLAGHEATGGE
jgi:hypothetical protein